MSRVIKIIILSWGFLLLVTTAVVAAQTQPLKSITLKPSQTEVLKLGDNLIQLCTYGSGSPTYVHLHANEKTSLVAAKQMIKTQGGTIITIAHQGGRLVEFTENNQRYRFDPNRIFTKKGRIATLKENSSYSANAEKALARLAKAITRSLPPGRIIAIHNNSIRYNINSYKPGARFASDAKSIHINPTENPRNFFYVTRQQDFSQLQSMKFNVVLQDSKNVTDDGSLSVYAEQTNRQYINVEAGHGMLASQMRMLRALQEMK